MSQRGGPVNGDVREDGEPYVTPVVEFSACEWCNTATPIRAQGRRPRFCSVACRKARYRAEERVKKAYAELLAAEEALKAGATATSTPG